MSDGIIRVRNNTDLSLEFASSRTSSTGSASTHRYHLIGGDISLKDITDIIEFLVGGNPNNPEPNPVVSTTNFAEFILNNQFAAESMSFTVEFSTDLKTWATHSELVSPSPDQANVPAGFTRMRIAHPSGQPKHFHRLRVK